MELLVFVAGVVGLLIWQPWRDDEDDSEGEEDPEMSTDAPSPAVPASRIVTGYRAGVAYQMTVVPVGNGRFLRADAADAWLTLQAAAAGAGFILFARSGWRSNEEQVELRGRYEAALADPELAQDGRHNFAMKAGYSPHQAGTDVDIGGLGGYGTPAYRWLEANARGFGFSHDVSGAAASEYWHWGFHA